MAKLTQEEQRAKWREQYRKHKQKQQELARLRSRRRRAKERAAKDNPPTSAKKQTCSHTKTGTANTSANTT
jgi:hypothetical protein